EAARAPAAIKGSERTNAASRRWSDRIFHPPTSGGGRLAVRRGWSQEFIFTPRGHKCYRPRPAKRVGALLELGAKRGVAAIVPTAPQPRALRPRNSWSRWESNPRPLECHPVASVHGCARLCVNPAFPAETDAASRTVAHTQTALLPVVP